METPPDKSPSIDDKLPSIEDYAPYHHTIEFQRGMHDYNEHNFTCPFDTNSVEAQAWHRGFEYAMKMKRYSDMVLSGKPRL
jgi:hypothetical protein